MDKETAELKNYEQKCKDIWVNTEKEQIIQVCKKYLRYLDKSESWINLSTFFDISLLLNYWIYDKLTRIYPNAKDNEVDIGFAALQGKWDTFDSSRMYKSYYEKCRLVWKMVNHTDWDKRKQLFEYYVDYDTLFRTASIFFPKCQKYYVKIKEFPSLYEYFRGKCSNEEYECPEVFDKFKNEDRMYDLEKLQCREQMEQAIAAASAAQSKASSHHPEGAEQRQGASGDGPGKGGSEFTTPVTQITSQTSDIGTKVSHSVLGAAPVLLTATMLYRHTPLGPWIRRLRGGRTNSINTIDTFSHYTPETGEMFSDDPANYISYQPM
ncbi:hypothetical protein PVNG_05604 [Plasmodium vivax North Korean]|uniref:VIR protein n=1 Tax=Plasmodium vivax North Korean TaxID=1035514 RepID=A0A0J9U1B0_PLAVI|nr:hypothetical protein PVNG_05604 [Plasmodium vivax North Korean]